MQSFSRYFFESERGDNVRELEELLNSIDLAIQQTEEHEFTEEEKDYLIQRIGRLAQSLENERLPEELYGRAGKTVTSLNTLSLPESVMHVINSIKRNIT